MDDFYRDYILDHYRNPHNFGHLEDFDADAEDLNPLCGDQIRMELKLDDGVVRDLRFSGKGCAISQAAAPLDRYSFPSGHTLHAVSFAWQACAHFPELSWVLLPLTALIAGSRVVLGLHYPTDVLAGAIIGAALAELGLAFA